jgi:hypothetical protein
MISFSFFFPVMATPCPRECDLLKPVQKPMAPREIAAARVTRFTEESSSAYTAKMRALQPQIDKYYARIVAYAVKHEDDRCAIVYSGWRGEFKDNDVCDALFQRLTAAGYEPEITTGCFFHGMRLFRKDKYSY